MKMLLLALRSLRREWHLPELRTLTASLVLAVVALGVVSTLATRIERGMLASAAELIGGGNLQHRVPVDRWVVVRRGCLARGDRCGNGNPLSGLRARLRTVYQAVTTCPDLIASRWKIGDDETTPIVGDDTFDVADR